MNGKNEVLVVIKGCGQHLCWAVLIDCPRNRGIAIKGNIGGILLFESRGYRVNDGYAPPGTWSCSNAPQYN